MDHDYDKCHSEESFFDDFQAMKADRLARIELSRLPHGNKRDFRSNKQGSHNHPRLASERSLARIDRKFLRQSCAPHTHGVAASLASNLRSMRKRAMRTDRKRKAFQSSLDEACNWLRDSALELSDILGSARSWYESQVQQTGIEVLGFHAGRSLAARMLAHQPSFSQESCDLCYSGESFYCQCDWCLGIVYDISVDHIHVLQKGDRREAIERRKRFRNRLQACTKQCRRLARIDRERARCDMDQRRLNGDQAPFRHRGGRRKLGEALEHIVEASREDKWSYEDEVASMTHVPEILDMGLATQSPPLCSGDVTHSRGEHSNSNMMQAHPQSSKDIKEHEAGERNMVEPCLPMKAKNNEHMMSSTAVYSGVVLEVATIGGLIFSRKNVLPNTMVSELKQTLAPHVGVPACRQRLVYGSTLLDDDDSLQHYDLSSQLMAAKCCGGPPVQLSLVALGDPIVAVPDDYGSISEAVASLPGSGGMVQLTGPPTVSEDVIEIRNSNISIIAVTDGAVDVRQAKLYIKTPHTTSEMHVCIHGLKNMSRVVVIRCGHNGCIAFRDCDLLPAKELHVHTPKYRTYIANRTLTFCRSDSSSMRCGGYKNWKDASKTMYLDYSKSTVGVARIPWPACSAPVFLPRSIRSFRRGVWNLVHQASERTMQSSHSTYDSAWPCLASNAESSS